MSSSELKDAVQRRGPALRLETLAFLVRYARGQSQDGVELLEAVMRQLLKRTRPIARSVGHRAIGSADWQDGRQHAFFSMLRDFEARYSDELTFWEVNFPHIFKRRCIDGLNAQRRKADRNAVSIEVVAEEAEALRTLAARPIDQLIMREILSILTPEEAIAARLAWFDGLPISGAGSVAEVMAVSRKTVHKYLARARTKVEVDSRFDEWTN